MDQILAVVGKIGPPGLLVVVCLMILSNRLVTSGHVATLTGQLKEQIATMQVEHDKQITTITSQNITQYERAMEMAKEQVTWSVTRGNDWKDAYDGLADQMPLVVEMLQKSVINDETVIAAIDGIRKKAEENDPSR